MKIEVLGMGCARCDKLEQEVHDALKELDIQAEVVKVSDLDKISSYGVLMTPGLVINGKVYSSGKIPEMVALKKWIKDQTEEDIERLEGQGVAKLFGPGTPTQEIIDYITTWSESVPE